MKPIRILIFIFSVIFLLGVCWFFFPAEGVTIGNHTFRFPSYAEDTIPAKEEIDVDEVLSDVRNSFMMTCSEDLKDSLRFFQSYLKENPNRIFLPNNDYTYFDTLFALLDQAKAEGKIYRIMHYGDSQIETDRISSVVRQKLQEYFGGSGPNMIPAIQPVPTISVTQDASNLRRYMVYGDGSRASHKRYGVMAQFGLVSGSGTITFNRTNSVDAFEKAKEISMVSVLLGKNSEGFSATLKCDDYNGEAKVLHANDSVSLITWRLPSNVKHGSITFKGHAEIYAVLLDGEAGVALDNVALRGCAGNIFTRIDERTLRQSFELLDTRMIILQFGGNRMPGITSRGYIHPYINELENQIDYIKNIAPQATLLFIGPADMSKSVNGKLCTWPLLPELNDSLRNMALRKGVAYWDMFHVMGGEGSMIQWVQHKPQLAQKDYIHFTFKGAQEIGTDLAKSFTTYFDFYKLRQRVPSEEIIKFFNLDHKQEDPICDTSCTTMPYYEPYINTTQ